MADTGSGFECLELENQLCFPLYVCSKEIIRRYRPFLEELDLTYPQYITMLALWEYGEMSVKQLGSKVYLDSGTLTPLLNKLEDKGYVSRRRGEEDWKLVMISLTDDGIALRERAKKVPESLGACIPLDQKDAAELYRILRKLMADFEI